MVRAAGSSFEPVSSAEGRAPVSQVNISTRGLARRAERGVMGGSLAVCPVQPEEEHHHEE